MTAPPTSNPQVNPALGVCEYCGTPNDDAGPGIGTYCPAAACPGDAIYAARAREMVEADRIRNASETLEACGYRVDKSSGETPAVRRFDLSVGVYENVIETQDPAGRWVRYEDMKPDAQDAARYRFLRNEAVEYNGCPHIAMQPDRDSEPAWIGRERADAAIDGAMRRAPTTDAAESSHCKVHAKPNAQCPECMS